MASGHLVASTNFALLGDTDTHQLIDAWRQFIALVSREYLHLNDFATLTMGYAQGGVFHLASLFTKHGSQKLLLGGQFGLALRRNLTDENILRPYLGANIDDATLVEVTQPFFAYIWDVPRDLFGSQLCVARIDLVFLNMYRGEEIFTHYALADEDCIFEVTTLPAHKGDKYVLSKRNFSIFCG